MEQLTLLLGDSLANPTQAPESVKAKKMSATYGRRCLEQYERFPRVSSWAKMFAASLIGMEGWYSRRCALSWKVMGIKSRPLLYLRARSTPHINESGFGLLPTMTASDSRDMNNKLETGSIVKTQSNGFAFVRKKDGMRFGASMREIVKTGLLPTPMAQSRETTIEQTIERQKKYGGKTRAMYLENFAVMGMLPTPNASEGYKASKTYNPNSQAGTGLSAMAANGMLPTPATRDYKGANSLEHLKGKNGNKMTHENQLPNYIKLKTGSSSQLNPQFVGEMMGFPSSWTELPFLSGEPKVSKPTETP